MIITEWQHHLHRFHIQLTEPEARILREILVDYEVKVDYHPAGQKEFAKKIANELYARIRGRNV